MKDNVLVSVVTITYNLIKANRERFVRQCIECVKNQTYPFVEHIIVDGASIDGTLEIFNDYPWLKVFSEPDKGIYDAMNKGVSHASGKYIVFLNSDDFWHSNRAIEESVKALEKNDADFSYSSARYIDENGKFLGYLFPILESFFLRMPFSHQSMFTRTDLVKFKDNYKLSADYDFVLRLILSGAKGVHVPLDFTSFRWIGASSGKSDNYGNEGCKLGDEECINSLVENYSRFGVDKKQAEKIFFDQLIEKDLLVKIIANIDADLAAKIRKKYLLRKNNKTSIFIKIPVVTRERKFRFGNFTIFKVKYYERFKLYYLFKYLPVFILPR